MSQISIGRRMRAARPGDGPAVDALLARSYPRLLAPDYAPEVLAATLPLISTARPTLLASGTYYLLEEDGVLRAAGGWTRSTPFGGEGVSEVGHIRHVVSCPDHLRRGFAGRVLRHSIYTAKAAGVLQLECYSTITARPFYEAMGFVALADVSLVLRPGVAFPAVHMRRMLD